MTVIASVSPTSAPAAAVRAGKNPLVLALLLGPSLIFLAAFAYWPVLLVLVQSFSLSQLGEHGFGLGNYARLLSDQHFGIAILNNIIYAVGTIVPSLVLALAFALALQNNKKVTAVLRTLIVMPLFIPLVAAAALFSFIYLPGGGLIDFYLAKLGIGQTNWLGSPSTALPAVIVVTIWKNTGYYMLFFLAGLAAIPTDLLDAAKMDGATALGRLRHIILPLLGPTFAFVLPIALLNALTQIDHVVTMWPGGPSDDANLLLYYIYQQAVQNNDSGLGAAATVVGVGGLLALTTLARQALDRSIHYES
ncbi:sugar ABC transporter permease [Methylovirgula sp. 4M-Z18]|nr:sugar ABC transporter permease [Methylovirgula sp. 4M-Z18]